MNKIAVCTLILIVVAWITFIFSPEVFSVIRSDIEFKRAKVDITEKYAIPGKYSKMYLLMYVSKEKPQQLYKLDSFETEEECIREKDSENWKTILYDQFGDNDPRLICQTRSFQY